MTSNLPPGCADAAIERAIADGAETLDEIQAAIDYYQGEFRQPKHAPLGKVSEPYALDPYETRENGTNQWPYEYPNLAARGVYFFFDADMELVYIGKASCDSSFVQCFSRHIAGGIHDSRGTPKGNWARSPKYRANLPMQYPHEAPSLEEWLIERFGAEIENYAGNPHHPRKAKNGGQSVNVVAEPIVSSAETILSGRPLAHCFTG